jgi:hypothetical protein
MDRVTLGVMVFAVTVGAAEWTGGRLEAMDAVPVTECGQEFAGVGYLVGDLNCATTTGPAVVITGKGSLDFRGFTIVGGEAGIVCLQSCTVNGPGMLTSTTSVGIGAAGALALNNLTVANSGGDGIVGYRQVRVDDSVLLGNSGSGVRSERVVIRGSVVTGNGNFGAFGGLNRRVVLRDSQVVGNGLADDCTLGAPCADVASGRKPRLRNSTCDTSWDPSGGAWDVCVNDAGWPTGSSRPPR